jgi:hypothetical protein
MSRAPSIMPSADLSLAGVEFESGVRATRATGKAPPPPKRRKGKGKK